MKARHAALSFTTSCQLVSFVRSLLTTSTHLSGAPPGGLFFLRGRHFISCFWGRSSDILCTWPNHCNRFCLNCSSIGNSPVSSSGDTHTHTDRHTHTHTHTHTDTHTHTHTHMYCKHVIYSYIMAARAVSNLAMRA